EAAIYVPLKIVRTINEKTNKEAKKDHKILKKRFLKYWEWDLLNHLLELFKPIEEATEWLEEDDEAGYSVQESQKWVAQFGIKTARL
ncbi:7736_t:CDS:2, partial [Gigaspora rosea]